MSDTRLLAQQQPRDLSPASAQARATAPLEDREGVVVPFRYEPPVRPIILIQARINNSDPLTFEVDTGSTYVLVLAPWAQHSLHLLFTDQVTRIQPGNFVGQVMADFQFSPVTAPGSLPMNVKVQGAVVADLPFMNQYLGPKIAGIIGGNIFGQLLSRFDFDKQTLTFFTGEHPPVQVETGGVALPLVNPDGYLPSISLTFNDQARVNLMVDTGLDSTLLPEAITKKLIPLARGRTAAATTFEGEHIIHPLLLEQLTIGAVVTPLAPVSARADLTTGSLGLDLLARFRVTLDPIHKQLLLEPRKKLSLALRGDSRMRVTLREGSYILTAVAPPQKAQGAAVGDRVVAVNDHPLADLTLIQANIQLDGTAGVPMRVTLQKPDKKQVTLSLVPRSWYEGVVVSDLGVILHAVKKGPSENKGLLVVCYVAPGSAAAASKIEIGDELVEVNGVSATTLTAEEVMDCLPPQPDAARSIVSLLLRQSRDGSLVKLEEPITQSVVSSGDLKARP